MYLTSSIRALFFLVGISVVQLFAHAKSPRLTFSKEPPNQIEFVNTRGTKIECTANGHPTPNISWILLDGTTASDIPGLRETSSSGSLIFHSFRPERFRPDVHSSLYRCVASNGAGVIHSRNVRVRGVVLQNVDIQVYDVYAMKGSTAVFKCHIPSVLEEYIVVTSWIKNDNILIQPAIDLASNDKYAVMPLGELHIRDASLEDNGSRYKCKATHRLTDDVLISSTAGQIFVTEPRGSFNPRIVHSSSSIIGSVGQNIALPCAFQGYPIPSVRWYRKNSNEEIILVNNSNRIVTTTSALIIKDAQILDKGNYICEVSNELGNERVDVSLTIQDPLSAIIQPVIQEVQIGTTSYLKCIVNGQPVASITWLHNGTPIKNAADDTLTLKDIQLIDQGLYQCIVKNSFEMVQAIADIQLTEVPPQFVETFEEVVVQPHSSVILKCSADGIPSPIISWDLDGIKVNSSSRVTITSEIPKEGSTISRLVIPKIAVEEGGLYTCTATNKGGRSIHSSRVNVYGPLGAHRVPALQLISGGNATLHCPLYGFPIPEILWEKAEQKMPIDLNHIILNNGSLYLKNIDRRVNSGVYKCIGDMVEGSVTVQVLVTPKIIPFDFLDDQFYKGMRAHVTCAISQGDLPVTFEWLKDGVTISPQLGVVNRQYDDHMQSLSIDNVSSHHSGNYTCVARNRAGTAEHTAQLLVRGKVF